MSNKNEPLIISSDETLATVLSDRLNAIGFMSKIDSTGSQVSVEKVYNDDAHTSIRIGEHLEQLVSNLMYSYGDPFEPKIAVLPANMEMDIDTAIPLSLIVNELVTNAMKYAYEGINNPEMSISLNKPNGHYLLDFSDNGVGIDHDKDTSNSFGIRLIKSLVAQLNGTLEIVDIPTGGTRWLITLNTNET